MAALKNIIFDLGGVLLNLNIQKTLDAYQEMGLEQIESLFGIGHAASYFKDYEKGLLDSQEFVAAIRNETGAAATEAAVIAAWNAMLLDFPEDRVDLLRKLRSEYRLFLFSNTNALHYDHFQQYFRSKYGFEMDSLFDKAYYSHLVNLRKPDAAAFQLVLNEQQLNPGETAFVDDALVNVEAARQLGLTGILLKPDQALAAVFS